MESYPKQQTKKRSSVVRCINLDWLEVFAHEPAGEPRDHVYFMSRGFSVEVRPYGTRVYREMFTIIDNHGQGLIEVRRDPASQGLQGIHDSNACHIRLCNRTCYFDSASVFLSKFLQENGYSDIRISRIDLCLDFVRFDLGDNPAAFVRRYFRHKFAKINQGRITSHGADLWLGQEWNSLSWGSKTSPVTTKMYDKTLELYDQKSDTFKKPYIREAWFYAGLIDDIQRVTKDGMPVKVWRVEFSLRSAVKGWVKLVLNGDEKQIQSIKNDLDVYKDRQHILTIFASLARHYFRFKKFESGKRKDRCDDKVLFDFTATDQVYKIGKNEVLLGDNHSFKSRYQRLIEKLKEFQLNHKRPELFKACQVIIDEITTETEKQDLANPFDPEELFTLRELIRLRTADKTMTYDAAMEEIRKMLKLNENTLPHIL